MSSDDIPDRVFAFLAEAIETVPQLEALLLLWDTHRPWSADELAARIYVQAETAAAILQALQRRRLLREVEGAVPIRYEYDSGWDPSGERIAEIARAYRQHVVRLATFIHAGASSSVREFARAFELKKGSDS